MYKVKRVSHFAGHTFLLPDRPIEEPSNAIKVKERILPYVVAYDYGPDDGWIMIDGTEDLEGTSFEAVKQ